MQSNKQEQDLTIGRYRGTLAERYRTPEFLQWLEKAPERIRSGQGHTVASGRNQSVRMTFQGRDILFKSFGRPSWRDEWRDRRRGAKADRTWRIAQALEQGGVGTPPPVGFLERRQAGRLVESYYLSEYQAEVWSFSDELARLFREDPSCEKLMTLLQCVAEAIRRMHEVGIQHNDLGNQNILIRRAGEADWGQVYFIDLNRARVRARLSDRQRARDISRIYLPSDLLRMFKEMYWAQPPPETFQRWEKLFRRQYAVHSCTRNLRHPIRRWRSRRNQATELYPPEKEMWIWDERSAQAISPLRPRDRNRFYSPFHLFEIGGALLAGGGAVWRNYRRLLDSAYRRPVELAGRIGVALSPDPAAWEREKALLERLGSVPVLLRFYAHETAQEWDFLSKVARELADQGHQVSVALVQDRNAVRDIARWKSFVGFVLERVASVAEWVEVGHAVNRVKWGIWNFAEHRRLMDGVAAWQAQYPDLKMMGPACIDFEYPFLMTAVRKLAGSLHFAALSHHLYVDRRGAPESRQAGFATLEKCAMARAIAQWSPACEDRLILSEVNWPLLGTGVYSPVTSPYESPGPRYGDPSVSEDAYADYMLRYLLITLCSGMAERVFWWRLVARGFGLVDDSENNAWRERPAYRALARFLQILGRAVFQQKVMVRSGSGEPEIHVFVFQLPEGGRVGVAYVENGKAEVECPFEVGRAEDAVEGRPVEVQGRRIALSVRPLYLFEA